ncbi:nSTAND1 domain-containing NTPase [Streptomyces violaceus]|uniref:Novel STAND NTPase 1 domain-containing protein n=1 Tax=Streptomyces violaceus TaxID=1936 RepID=A0ABY9UM72_STRVL|nr:hypothetical protein [Streptomyces janthinus]WND21892.1 hypothetical protein RI060_33060 [Streptomyces janthinus]
MQNDRFPEGLGSAMARVRSADGTPVVLSDCAQIIAPLGRTGLLGAIEGPASRVPGLTLDPGLAERIVDDAENEPGHLPMVEFALTELWSLQAGVRLTHTGYEALGGVTGALSTHAEKRVGATGRSRPGAAIRAGRSSWPARARPRSTPHWSETARTPPTYRGPPGRTPVSPPYEGWQAGGNSAPSARCGN